MTHQTIYHDDPYNKKFFFSTSYYQEFDDEANFIPVSRKDPLDKVRGDCCKLAVQKFLILIWHFHRRRQQVKTIWKFELTPSRQIEMPKGAKIISAGNQNNLLTIWAEVDEGIDTETRYFDVIGTGHELYTDMALERRFIDTVILNDFGLVWHIYERLTL